jgi:hypothetical protein
MHGRLLEGGVPAQRVQEERKTMVVLFLDTRLVERRPHTACVDLQRQGAVLRVHPAASIAIHRNVMSVLHNAGISTTRNTSRAAKYQCPILELLLLIKFEHLSLAKYISPFLTQIPSNQSSKFTVNTWLQLYMSLYKTPLLVRSSPYQLSTAGFSVIFNRA